MAFGKGGWTIAYGGNIGGKFERQARRAAEVTADFRRYYLSLKDVAITHGWSGPIDRTPDSLPLLGCFSGHINICLRKDEWSNHPLVGRRANGFPPEPIRFIGAHVVRAAVASKERAEIKGKKPSKLSVQLSKLAPAGLEDKS